MSRLWQGELALFHDTHYRTHCHCLSVSFSSVLLALSGSTLLLSSQAVPATTESLRVMAADWQDCVTISPIAKARCLKVSVPLQWTAPTGTQIEVAVKRIYTTSPVIPGAAVKQLWMLGKCPFQRSVIPRLIERCLCVLLQAAALQSRATASSSLPAKSRPRSKAHLMSI
jgi:hypothetical protein